MNAATAQALAGRWIHLTPRDAGYADITNGITISSALSEITVTGHLVLLPPRTLNGIQVTGIRGLPAGQKPAAPGVSATLWVTTAAPHLPVAFDTAGPHMHLTVQLSQWGTGPPATVDAPSNSVNPGGRPTA